MRPPGIRQRPPILRWPAWIAAAFLFLIFGESATDRHFGAAESLRTAAEPLTRPIPYPPDFETALADSERAETTARARATASPGWLSEEMLARAFIERARLNGSVEDLVAADQALARSAALAPPGSGPNLLRAMFELSVHRLDRAEAQLDLLGRYAVAPSLQEQAEIEAMRGDIALYRGQHDQALRHYDRADRFTPGSTGFRRAYFRAASGDIDRALSELDLAERRSNRRSIQTAARTELQRGIFALEAGQIDRARNHFLRADSLFPGDWLIEEHVAEILALSGEPEIAARRYRHIVARTEAPEYMDALARIARDRNDFDEARRWSERAGTLWRRRLALFPEAYYASAADHCLAVNDADCAVRMAQLNYRSRPYGEAAALLAEALVSAGREREASEIATALDRSRWQSPRTRRVTALLRQSR